MNSFKNNNDEKWLDDLLGKSIGSEKVEPDFEKWRQNHPQAVEMLISQANRQYSASICPLSIWRIIMKSSITKLAAAAVIIITAILGLNTIFNKSAAPAYALEQTIQACHSVRYLHIKRFIVSEDEAMEFWVEFDEKGNVKNIRGYMPEWDSPEDGAKVLTWRQGKAEVWLKKKNILMTVKEQRIADVILNLAREFDPKSAVQNLQEKETAGQVKLKVDEPADKAKPITITATGLFEGSKLGHRVVLSVDQATKLVTAIEVYRQSNTGEYEFADRFELCDYNQQIDPAMFALSDVPKDVMRIDQTTGDVGLPQDSLSDNEIAVKVVREFFEALMAMDYDKAGKLFEGVPGEKLWEKFGNIKVLRIISIGPAGPHPIPETKGLAVPTVVEIEKDGKISEWKLECLGVRELYNQPGRWTIFGGI